MTHPDGSPRDSAWIGHHGERIAAAYLRTNGCRILKRNFRGPRKGEVDLIARHDKLLLFVEVKTRRTGGPVRPFDAVDAKKRELIERGANAWLRKLGTRALPWRFDVIEVLLEEGEKPVVRWIRNAF